MSEPDPNHDLEQEPEISAEALAEARREVAAGEVVRGVDAVRKLRARKPRRRRVPEEPEPGLTVLAAANIDAEPWPPGPRP